MTVGNVLALWQDDLRRLLAYSSIAHAGYMLIGLAVGLATGNAPVLERLGGAGVLSGELCGGHDRRVCRLGALRPAGTPHRGRGGIGRAGSNPTLGRRRVGRFLFSLTGVPPLAGFWGKLWLFGSALNVDGTAGAGMGMQPWFTGLAIVGVLNAAIAAAYYLRVVAVMYFRTPLATPRAEGGGGPWWAAVVCGLAVVLIGLFPAR